LTHCRVDSPSLEESGATTTAARNQQETPSMKPATSQSAIPMTFVPRRASRRTIAALTLAAAFLATRGAQAHVTIASPTAVANTTQELTFSVGHGCAGADTSRVRVEIPAGVTSVRPETSDFGKTSIEKDATGAITAVVWQKADADVLESDTQFYKLVVRLKIPNVPFTTVLFPAHQTCRAADGTVTTVDWAALPGDPAPPTGEVTLAPGVSIVPAHAAGWNTVVVPQAVPVLSAFFADAQIVWKGAAAYSANPATVELIAATPGVTPLTSLTANDTVWVKY
jgi:uncharacterized protein YcnI